MVRSGNGILDMKRHGHANIQLPEHGGVFGKIDHGTVKHAGKVVERIEDAARKIEAIKEGLEL